VIARHPCHLSSGTSKEHRWAVPARDGSSVSVWRTSASHCVVSTLQLLQDYSYLLGFADTSHSIQEPYRRLSSPDRSCSLRTTLRNRIHHLRTSASCTNGIAVVYKSFNNSRKRTTAVPTMMLTKGKHMGRSSLECMAICHATCELALLLDFQKFSWRASVPSPPHVLLPMLCDSRM